MRTHVVIGDGATAARFACSAPLQAGDRLVIVGPAVADLGRGLAYRDHPTEAPWRYAYLLNSPNEMVHAAFSGWLTTHWAQIRDRIAGVQPHWLAFGAEAIAAGDLGALFAPRAIFGDWVEEQTRIGLAELRDRGVTVEERATTAVALEPEDAQLRVHLATGETLLADAVDLATGGAATQPLGTGTAPGIFEALYGAEPDIAAALAPGDWVTCLGGNAAMLDVLRLLQSLMPERDIRMRVITRGRLPEPLVLHRPRRPAVAPMLAGGYDDAPAALQALDAEIARFREAGAEMAALRSGFSGWFAQHGLAGLVADPAAQRTVQAQLERRFRRGTQDSLADFTRLRAAGQIELLSGTVEAVTPQGAKGARVDYWQGDSRASVASGIVINTSGPSDPLALDPLAADLLARGILQPNATRSGITLGPGLRTTHPALRYLSPAVTEIGGTLQPFPLYDVARLWQAVDAAQTLA